MIRSLIRGLVCTGSMAAVAGVLSLTSIGRAEAAEFVCKPVDVAEFPNVRVHVRCSPGAGAIQYFALGVAKSGDADRVLNLATAALVHGKRLTIFYDPASPKGTAIGCSVSDCRLIQGIILF